MVRADGGSRPTLQGTQSSTTGGSARPRGGVPTAEVANLSRRGSAPFNRRAYVCKAPARGAVGRGPAALRALVPGKALTHGGPVLDGAAIGALFGSDRLVAGALPRTPKYFRKDEDGRVRA